MLAEHYDSVIGGDPDRDTVDLAVVAQEAVRMDTITGLVASGFGVSIVPSSVARRPTADVVFARLSPEPTPSTWPWPNPAKNHSPLVANFVALVQDLTHM